MSANQQAFEGATSNEQPLVRQRLVLRAIERAEALLKDPSTRENTNAARLHMGYYTNMSDKTIEQWLKETDENNCDGDDSSSSDEGDKGTRAPHAASAGKKKATREPSAQDSAQEHEKAAEMAEAAVTGKHGIDIDRDALKIDKLDEKDYFVMAKEHQKLLQTPAGVTHIPFLIPTKLKDVPATYKSMFAVRLNEAYEDAHAITSGERTYTRQHMLRAEQIFVITTNSKNPIMFMS